MNILMMTFMILMLLTIVTTARLSNFVRDTISEKYVSNHFLELKRESRDNLNQKLFYDHKFSGLSVAHGINYFKYYPSKINLAKLKKSPDSKFIEVFKKAVDGFFPGEEEKSYSSTISDKIVEELKKSGSENGYKRIFSTERHLANIDFEDREAQKHFFYLLNSPEVAERSAMHNFADEKRAYRFFDIVMINDKIAKSFLPYQPLASPKLLEILLGEEKKKMLWDKMLEKKKNSDQKLKEIADRYSGENINTAISNLGEEEKKECRNYLKREEVKDIIGELDQFSFDAQDRSAMNTQKDPVEEEPKEKQQPPAGGGPGAQAGKTPFN